MSYARPPQLAITGGRGGLARAIVEKFADGGWDVRAPGRAELDVTDANNVAEYFAHHTPELLICNAGLTRDAPLARLTPDAWQEVMEVNYHGTRRCATAVLTEMCRRGGGHIIFLSSHSALHPPVGQAAYATAKAALLGLTRDLATAAGPHGVRVNAILPGFLETPMTSTVSATRRQQVIADHALGRFNTVEAVASFIWHLHHDLPHTSGQMFQLDSRPA